MRKLHFAALAAVLVFLPQASCARAGEGQAQSANKPAGPSNASAASPGATQGPAASSGSLPPTRAEGEGARPGGGVNRARLKAQAEELSRAFERKDYAAAVALMHAKVAELAGGRESLLAFLDKTMKEMEEEGMKIDSFTFGEPRDFASAGGRVFAILPTRMKATFGKRAVESDGFWLAVSEDGGENWTFVRLERGEEKERVRVLFPEAADKLRLPQGEPPAPRKEP